MTAEPPPENPDPDAPSGGSSSVLERLFAGEGLEAEKYRASERGIAPIRFLVAVFTGGMFAFVRGPDPILWLALVVIAVAVTYSGWVWWVQPQERFEFLGSSPFISLADATLISLFLVATGGFASPFFPLWYVSVIALSLRFGVVETLAGASLYVVAYGAITGVMDGFWANLPTFLVRSGYVYIAALLGLMASMLVHQEMVERRQYQHLSRRLEDTADDLRQALSVQQASFDATADGLLVVDDERNVVAYNQRFREMWNLPEDPPEEDPELLRTVLGQVEDAEGFMEDVHELYRNPEQEGYHEVRFEDGRVFERYSRPRRIGDEIVGRVWSFRDVTDERKARQELEEANEKLRRYAEAAEQELEFAHAAAHDLKEPARMVASYMDLLRQEHGHALDDEAEEMVEYAVQGASRMQNLVNGLLRYSRVDAAQADMEPVDAGQVLQEVLSSLSVRIQEEDATVEHDPLPVVLADEAQLGQVFQNLVTNAIKFSKQDQAPRVEVRAHREGSMWRISVTDNGIGMDPEEADDLFRLFRQGDPASRDEGQGIGLAICKKIVDHHGGRIDVDTKPGEGTTFSFTLPAPDAPAASPEEDAAGASPA